MSRGWSVGPRAAVGLGASGGPGAGQRVGTVPRAPIHLSIAHRKFELYTMEWNLKEDLRDCLVAAAPYGGPIGRVRPRPPGTLRWGRGCPGPPAVMAQTDCPIPPTALLKNNARKEKSPSARPLLEIYSASGLLLASIPVSCSGGGRPLL